MPPKKRQRNQRGEGQRLKSEIMEAAMRLLDRVPANKLSLRMIATEAGITPTAIYSHFPNARVMTLDIVQECWDQMGEQLKQAALQLDEAEPIVILKAQMATYIDYAMQRPSHYQLLFVWHPVLGEENAGMRGPVRPVYRSILSTIERLASKAPTFPVKDPVSAAMMVFSITHGRIALALLAPKRPGNSSTALKQFVADSIDQIFGRE